MDCPTFHRNLEDYLEGGLDFAGRFGMERHASRCFACEKEIAAALKLRQMARELQKVYAPPDFEGSLLTRIQAEESRGRFWGVRELWLYGFEGFSWRVAGVTAIVTVLIVGTIGYFHYGMLFNRPAITQSGEEVAGSRNGNVGDLSQAAAGEASATNSMSALDIGNFSRLFRDNWAIPYAEPGDSDFVDIAVPGPGGQQLIMQLPRTIRMRYGQPSREYFIRKVSH